MPSARGCPVARELSTKPTRLHPQRPSDSSSRPADGVHVADEAAVEQARAILGPDRLIGVVPHEARTVHKASPTAPTSGVGAVNESRRNRDARRRTRLRALCRDCTGSIRGCAR